MLCSAYYGSIGCLRKPSINDCTSWLAVLQFRPWLQAREGSRLGLDGRALQPTSFAHFCNGSSALYCWLLRAAAVVQAWLGVVP